MTSTPTARGSSISTVKTRAGSPARPKLGHDEYLAKISDKGFPKSVVSTLWSSYENHTTKLSTKPFKLENIGMINLYYDVGITLGRGAHGFVKIGKNKKTKHMSALKFMKWSETDKKKLVNEYKIVSRISKCGSKQSSAPGHQYIICYEDLFLASYGKFNNKYYILQMEWFRGKELLSLVDCKNATKLKIKTSLIKLIVVDILKGLNYIHSQGMVHRDIKLNNVMFDQKTIKIVDLGDICNIEKCAGHRGTKMYFSPEKVLKLHKPYEIEEKSDIWAVGIMLLEMIVNYDLQDVITAMIKDLDEGTDSGVGDLMDIIPSVLGVSFPKGLGKLLHFMLEGDMDDRVNATEALELVDGDIGTYTELWNFWLLCDEKNKTKYLF